MRSRLALWLASALAASPAFAEFEAKALDIPVSALAPVPRAVPAPPAAPASQAAATAPQIVSLEVAASNLAQAQAPKAQVLTSLFENPAKTPAAEDDAPMSFLEARETLGALSRKTGLKRAPRLELDRLEPENAAANFDHFKGPATISVGPILLANSSRREMTSILAHELGHIAGKARRIAAQVALPALLAQALPILAWAAWGGPTSMPYALALGGIAAAWTLYLRASSHPAREELSADAFAARLTGDPRALAGVLEKWGESDPSAPARAARLRAMK